MGHSPTTNEERCSNCGTMNPVGQDKCIKCGQPLTRSAGMAERAYEEATSDTAVMGGRNEITTMGTGLTSADVENDAARRDTDLPIVPPRPA